jgi:hypothetical protein
MALRILSASQVTSTQLNHDAPPFPVIVPMMLHNEGRAYQCSLPVARRSCWTQQIPDVCESDVYISSLTGHKKMAEQRKMLHILRVKARSELPNSSCPNNTEGRTPRPLAAGKSLSHAPLRLTPPFAASWSAAHGAALIAGVRISSYP